MEKRWYQKGLSLLLCVLFLSACCMFSGGCSVFSGRGEEQLLEAAEDGEEERKQDKGEAGTDESSGGSRGDREGGESDGMVSDGSGSDSGQNPGQASASGGEPEAGTAAAAPEICVYVCGRVQKEGVYRLPAGSRVYEAIASAGGAGEGSDLSCINQAMQLADGAKLYIPAKGEFTDEKEAAGRILTYGMGGEESVPAGSAGAAAVSGDTSVSGAGASGGKVNINTADKAELMTLNGIGESRAQSIISYREENGAFGKPEDLKNVSGIGDGIFGRIEGDICTG